MKKKERFLKCEGCPECEFCVNDKWVKRNKIQMFFARLTCHLKSLKLLIGSIVCKYFGHKVHCEGYANTESGGEYFYCERCGWENSVIYY